MNAEQTHDHSAHTESRTRVSRFRDPVWPSEINSMTASFATLMTMAMILFIGFEGSCP